ncbi:endoplasmic reticulum-Golgi intermediate compartment protein 1 isoform X1 [Phyllostomus discolor]|uniref:Endoplasmic reticulum-Golgi intermediate compartment protein n=1 Tax=Phyllostomus discolor TaxID=89673 RepID=A0A7E6CTN8_9CHIR|nr:endoplasmic reticulum-Golgi intermediate compartment protein 1 isoform X1 [Phyllostomus discolor]
MLRVPLACHAPGAPALCMHRQALRVPRPASSHTQSQPGPRRAPSCSPPPPRQNHPPRATPSLSPRATPSPACLLLAAGPHTSQARVALPPILGHRFPPSSSWEPRDHPFPALCRASFGGPHPADRFDIYRKVPKDLTQPTYTGAIISICCCLFILFLFLSELTGFITTEVVNELYVDDPDKDSGGKIDVSLNISLPNLHCELVGLDIQDEMGRHEVGHIDNSMKIPLNNGVGCRFEGQFSINKVPGNFHVSTHSATAQPQNPDMTHIIHKLSFGDTLQVQNVHGAFNALGGADRLTSNPLASHDYILKIVPTVYEDKSGKQRYSYQYTVANKEYVAYSHTGRIIPAIWFRYDLSPITVKYTERRQPLYRFITTICAIIGGTFTVAGILDSCIFTASEAWKKIQLGKMH